MRIRGAIERVPAGAPAEEVRQRLEAADAPLVLEGRIESWPARGPGGWDAEGLARRIGALPARYKISPSHRHPDFAVAHAEAMFRTEKSTFGELIARIASEAGDASRCFLTGDEECLWRRDEGGSGWSEKLGALRDDCPLPDLVDPESLRTIWLWISGAGVRSWLHYDTNGCHNLNAQIRGAKRAWVFPPEALGRLYPFPLGGPVPAHNCCQVDIESPDLERFPLARDAWCLEGEVSAGDLLYLPMDWIHSFLHVGRFNVNVNFWWWPSRPRHSSVSARRAFLDQGTALYLAARSPEARAALADVDRALIGGTSASG